MPKVLNMKSISSKDAADGFVYVGRPTKWGNPFKIGVNGTREEVINKYKNYIYKANNDYLRDSIKEELKGKNLAC